MPSDCRSWLRVCCFLGSTLAAFSAFACSNGSSPVPTSHSIPPSSRATGDKQSAESAAKSAPNSASGDASGRRIRPDSSSPAAPGKVPKTVPPESRVAVVEKITGPVLVKPSPIGPESWATFRNGNRQLGVAKTTLPEKPELLWKFTTPDGMVGCAAIVGEQVYVPCLNGELVSVDRRTGTKQWSYRSIDNPDPKEFAPGFKAAPTVDATMVYVGDEEGTLHAVDRATGKRKWKFKTGDDIAGAVALVGDKLVFGSHDFSLYCLKAADGSIVWRFQTENYVNCSTAIEGNNTFIAGCDTKIRVIDIVHGKETHEVPLGDGAYLIASPAVLGDVLYVGTHDGRFVAVDWNKQQVVWTYTDPKLPLEYRSSAAVVDPYVLVGGYDKKLHCLDRKHGNEIWNYRTHARIESSPVVVGERVFVGSGDGGIYGVNLKDGKESWRFPAGRSIIASPAVGEKCLVIGTEGPNGTVFCFGAKGQ